ncbi:MAG: iron donor protein CyaY [Myxococcota bacterium]
MDDRTYTERTEQAFRRIDDAMEKLDPDDVETDHGGGYLTLSFRDGSKCVISTQRPVREIWMAADRTAWHFSFDEGAGAWVAKKTGEELYATVARVVGGKTGKPMSI